MFGAIQIQRDTLGVDRVSHELFLLLLTQILMV